MEMRVRTGGDLYVCVCPQRALSYLFNRAYIHDIAQETAQDMDVSQASQSSLSLSLPL